MKCITTNMSKPPHCDNIFKYTLKVSKSALIMHVLQMEEMTEEDEIFELETPSNEILEEMMVDRAEMMNSVDQQVSIM